jgi:hypothetical protein
MLLHKPTSEEFESWNRPKDTYIYSTYRTVNTVSRYEILQVKWNNTNSFRESQETLNHSLWVKCSSWNLASRWEEAEIKLSLCWIQHQVKKTYGKLEVHVRALGKLHTPLSFRGKHSLYPPDRRFKWLRSSSRQFKETPTLYHCRKSSRYPLVFKPIHRLSRRWASMWLPSRVRSFRRCNASNKPISETRNKNIWNSANFYFIRNHTKIFYSCTL